MPRVRRFESADTMRPVLYIYICTNASVKNRPADTYSLTELLLHLENDQGPQEQGFRHEQCLYTKFERALPMSDKQTLCRHRDSVCIYS